uniref:Putative clptm1-like protein n=1 Tax=Ixodes ricinus TaxID=34613 RepID=V5ICQ1_IXORI
MKFSFTLALSGVFLAYILHSMWTLYTLYYPKRCGKNEACIQPTWTAESRFQFFFCTSSSTKIRNVNDLTVIWSENEFDIFKTSERQLNVTLPRKTLRNGTLHAYVLLLERKEHEPVRTVEQLLGHSSTSLGAGSLTRHLVPQDEEISLIGSATAKDQEVQAKAKLK